MSIRFALARLGYTRSRRLVDRVIRLFACVAAALVTACTAPAGDTPALEHVGRTSQAVATDGATTLSGSQEFSSSDGTIGTCSISPGSHDYGTQTILPQASGSYTMQTLASNSFTTTDLTSGDFGQYDTFIFVVQGAFDPASPNANVIACDDDVGPDCATAPLECLSSATAALTGGTSYTIVITTYGNDVGGTVAIETNGSASVATPSAIAATGGTPQSTAVSSPFGTALSVTVTDASSNPVAGVTVDFSAPGSGASASLGASSAVTDGSGVASVTATANATSGSYSVTATVTGVSGTATFSLTNTAAAPPPTPTSVTATSGSGQSAAAGAPFASSIVATVTDASSVPIAGVTVSFSAPGSGASASLASSSALTDVSGQATMAVTAGTIVGAYSVTASVVGVGTPATFSLTNTAGSPANISVASGSGQDTSVGTAFGSSLAALVTDVYGNAVPSASVTFAAPLLGASASLGSPVASTNAQGIATTSAVANATSGLYDVTASVGGVVTSASFSLTNDACIFSLGSPSTSAVASASSSSVALTASDPSCAWTASPNDAWISGVTASGTGSGLVAFSVGANTDAARAGTITIAGQTFTIDQDGGCSAMLGSAGTTEPAAGAPDGFSIALSGMGCAWTASSNDAWITSVTPSGTGSGTVAFTVTANAGAPRIGSITAGGATFTITQAGGCAFLLGSTGTLVPGGGLSSSVALVASDPSCPWTAQGSDPWIDVTTPSGTGTGLVAYTVAASTGPARIGSITAGGRTFTITQSSGCSAMLDTTNVSAPATGANATIHVTMSDSSCTWTASSTTSWLDVLSTSGTGSADVPIYTAPSNGPPRSTQATIAGQTVTVNEASGCAVNLAVAAGNASSSGGSSNFSVSTAGGCAFTASSNAAWITGVSVADGLVSYTVAGSNGATRVGTITLASTDTSSTATFSVTQVTGCAPVLSQGRASLAAAGSSDSFGVGTGPGCTLSAQTSNTWIHGVSATPTSVSYTVDTNAGPAREGAITVTDPVSMQTTTFTVDQGTGCTLSVAASPAATMTSLGGAASFAVTTGPGCTWTADTTDAWLSDVTVTAQGVSFSSAINLGASRAGTITVHQVDTGASVPAAIDQASGCAIGLPAASAEVALAGGASSFAVVSGPGCTWTAATTDTWVHDLVSSASGVSFVSDANSGVSRTATVTVTASETAATGSFIVQQSGSIVAPQILVNPVGAAVAVGDPISLMVTASGGDLDYQWRKNGTNIPNDTALTLRILSATTNDAGSYDVVVSNGAGSVVSVAVIVTVSGGGDGTADAGARIDDAGGGGVFVDAAVSDASSSDASLSDASANDASGPDASGASASVADAAATDSGGSATADAGSNRGSTDAGGATAART